MTPDNPPAFPRLDSLTTHDKQAPHTIRFSAESVDGMTLRDYFAAQALPQCIELATTMQRGHVTALPWDAPAAKAAYAVADAMLAERAKP